MNLGRASKIAGWMSDPELRFLASHAPDHKVILEAGSFQGKSTRALADNTDGVVYAIDPWKPMTMFTGASFNGIGVDSMTFTLFCLNMGDHIRSGKVIPTPMEFTKFQCNDEPTMIFIDARHDFNSVCADIEHAMKLMKTGLLCGHDYDPHKWPGVIEAVHKYFSGVLVTDTIWSVKL